MVTYADIAEWLDVILRMPRIREVGDLRPGRAPEDYLPTEAWLLERFEAGTADPDAVLRGMLGIATDHWERVSADGLDGLEAIDRHAADMAGSAVRVPEGIAFRFGDLTFRMRLDATAPGAGGPVGMRELVEADGARRDTLLGRLTSTPGRAARAAMQLRKLDDVLIRVLAARAASAETGIPVARILTLHRIEGNLCVYPSTASLELGAGGGPPVGIPSAAGDDLPVGTGREPSHLPLQYTPSFGHLVWLADPDAARTAAEAAGITRLAMVTILVHTIGGDRVGGTPTFDAAIDVFAEWSAGNRAATSRVPVPYADRLVDARNRWRALEGGLDTATLDGHDGAGPRAVRLTPRDPVTFLTAMLADAATYMEALHDASWLTGSSTTRRLPEGLAAMRYNWQGTPDGILATICSACAAARAGRGAHALRAAVNRDPQLVRVLQDARVRWTAVETAARRAGRAAGLRGEALRAHVDGHVRVEQARALSVDPSASPGPLRPDRPDTPDQMWPRPEVRAWLLAPGNLDALEDFIAVAAAGTGTGAVRWGGYAKVRRYAIAHRRLHDFYRRVFPEG
ncbi:MAG: hypothetical protein IT200_16515 [Thermoleophilia bacterium]|nr:hypothetical protein [Thermoleophilia bacterium]